MKRNVMGIQVDALTMGETVKLIDKYINNKEKCQHVVINAGKVVQAYKDDEFKGIINACEIVNADGQSIVWASKILKQQVPERVAGIDLMHELALLASKKEYGVYLFGAKEAVVQAVKKEFERMYPGIKIVGVRNGYFNQSDLPEIVLDMKQSKADILFVGFSSPQKEEFLNKYMDEIAIPFCMGVGGSFDVVAGVTKRAPLWMQKKGLEWFYRFIQEPRRMWKRYIVGNAKFCYFVFREKMSLAKKNGNLEYFE